MYRAEGSVVDIAAFDEATVEVSATDPELHEYDAASVEDSAAFNGLVDAMGQTNVGDAVRTLTGDEDPSKRGPFQSSI